ncbi:MULTISPECIES: hemerythrin domain-containing protein [Kytococcus]|uniref:hemerythrin domain-containing protein n=1 Tax=Kytococcus TaxID=57499 RepID=UPI0008A605CC|nr:MULTISPECIES: hemerythrin domain-containing protein [Kytococcus]OFS16057.1 hemerythrin [Kytococcus sp. HMSC28H12]
MCTYCGCESIHVIGRFMAEHDRLTDLTGPLHRAADAGDLPAAQEAAERIAELLEPHTHAEELGLFTMLRREEHIADHVDDLCAEHDALDAQLARIRTGDLAGVDAFVRQLRNHMDRENNGLFPAAAIALGGPEWDEVDELTPPAPTALG